jgi:prepilin-type N-terminal cleavage/methylation domain-containing protein
MNKRAFTLIELLIVVAIIAILAAIAVPNFLEAQVRSKVSRAQSDMRSIATAIEAYAVDHAGMYPMARYILQDGADSNNYAVGNYSDAGYGNFNGYATGCTSTDFTKCIGVAKTPGAASRCTFGLMPGLHTITTPTSYMTTCPADPFADTRGLVYGYSNMNDQAWIIWSYGPDCDEAWSSSTNPDKGGGQIGYGHNRDGALNDPAAGYAIAFNWPAGYYPGTSGMKCTSWPYRTTDGWTNSRAGVIAGQWTGAGGPCNPVYSPSSSSATPTLLTAGYTYDTTNGSKSYGDIWRIKQ